MHGWVYVQGHARTGVYGDMARTGIYEAVATRDINHVITSRDGARQCHTGSKTVPYWVQDWCQTGPNPSPRLVSDWS